MYTKSSHYARDSRESDCCATTSDYLDARGKSITYIVDQQQVLQARDVEILKPQGNGWIIKQGLLSWR